MAAPPPYILHNRSSEAAKHKHLTAVIIRGLLKTHRPNSKITVTCFLLASSSSAPLSNLLDFKVLFDMYFPVKSPPKRLTPETEFPLLPFFFLFSDERAKIRSTPGPACELH